MLEAVLGALAGWLCPPSPPISLLCLPVVKVIFFKSHPLLEMWCLHWF